MLVVGAYEKCKRYIEQHSSESFQKREIFPCVTISRQTGSGAYEVSSNLISILDEKSIQPDVQWTYFNKELLAKVLEEFNLPKAFSHYIGEHKYSHINDAVSELLGVKPSEWTIVHRTTEIILQLAHFGKTIIVGRGSNVITSKLPNCFHIKLVAPLENRLNHVQDIFDFTKSEAIEYIAQEDAHKKKFLKTHFFRDPDDLTLYHLVLNTGKLSYNDCASIIADSLMEKYPKCFERKLN